MPFIKKTEKQHVQERPGMYISTTETPVHLLTELIDNSADEMLSGYADTIVITMDYKNKVYSVADNGRGIPIKQKGFDHDIPIEIVTELRTGGKFDNDLYTQKSGLHGEGLTIVNFLSEWMEIEVKNKKKYYRYRFNQSESKDVTPEISTQPQKFSTKISFKPDKRFFDSLDISKEFIIERVKGILISAPEGKEVNVILQVISEDGKVQVIKVENDILKRFSDRLEGKYFVETFNGIRESDGKKITDSVTLYIGRVPDTVSFVFRGVVNTLPMDQGNHAQFIRKALNTYLYNKATKSALYVDEDNMVVGLNVLCIAKLSDPSFTGQQKYSLSGGLNKYAYIFDQAKIDAILDKHPEFVKEQIQLAQEIKMKKDTSKLEVKKSKNKVKVESLRDCSSKILSERELYIVEGKCAGGNLLKGRDVKRHAILPLRGKILNVLNSSFDKIVDSKTLSSIFNSIGIKPGDSNLSDLRYSKVVILTDADVDGFHIAALLISFFSRFAKTLINNGNLFVGETPLFSTRVNGKFVPLYNKEDMEKYRSNGYAISRIKGLGEMNAVDLAACAFDETRRKLIQVTESNFEEIESIWKNKAQLVESYIK